MGLELPPKLTQNHKFWGAKVLVYVNNKPPYYNYQKISIIAIIMEANSILYIKSYQMMSSETLPSVWRVCLRDRDSPLAVNCRASDALLSLLST